MNRQIEEVTMITIKYPTGFRARIAARLRHRPFIEVVQGDITTQNVDAIVNAAKSSLLGGGGVDGAIHRAGGPSILAQCRALRIHQYPDGLPVGHAVATTAGRMPATWVIHTVGPVHSGVENRAPQLRRCYVASLELAEKLGARTVAFPLIGAGAYGWYRRDALVEALTALTTARSSVRTVRLVVFDGDAYRTADTFLDRLEDGYEIR